MKKRNIRLKRKIFLWAGIADLLMILGASFSLAYFTSYDSVTNRLHATVMDVALFEDEFYRLTEKQKSTLVPNTLLPKDPRLQNVENIDLFVFMKVTVPVYETTVINDDGTQAQGSRRREVFYLKTKERAEEAETSFHLREDPNDKDFWVELTSFEEGKNGQDDTRTYVFGYCVYLHNGESTETLFDYIELKNIRQFEIDPDDRLNVKVEGYAVMADGIDGISKELGGSKNVLSEGQLSRIYRLIDEDDNNYGG